MRFVALLSGGKDSCYNIVKCKEHGHELVCVANLMPPDAAQEEMNSYMYQTAAHTAIPCVAECFGVPLVRDVVAGAAVVKNLDYDVDAADEVEDLHRLLAQVVATYPDVKGVSCGAIVSTHQRLRVEHVCQRLGLTPLCYLWMRDRRTLLDDMVRHGVHAVLVKVAGGGLEPRKHLGKDLATLRPTIQRLHDKMGLDYCGEGGEYETLVLACPGGFAPGRRLVLEETDVLLDEEDPDSVGNLRVLRCRVVVDEGVEAGLAVPVGGQGPGERLEADMWRLWEASAPPFRRERHPATNTQAIPPPPPLLPALPAPASAPQRAVMGVDGFGQTAQLTYRGPRPATADVAAQTRDVMQQLGDVIAHHFHADGTDRTSTSVRDACFVHLYLADMAHFHDVNAEYCRHFDRHPPSRACVAVHLPPGVLVAADAVFYRGSHRGIGLDRSTQRTCLHVRSMSEWAPLCIGPYAQANALPCVSREPDRGALVFVAGQIPLDPATMTVWTPSDALLATATATTGPPPAADPDPDQPLRDDVCTALQRTVLMQLALCLRHVARVLAPLGASLRRTLSCTVYLNADKLQECVATRLGPAPGAGRDVDAVRWLATKLCTVDDVLRLLAAVDAEECGGSGNDDGENDGENDSDDSDDDARAISGGSGRPEEGHVPPPVAVVFVRGIPRDCLVEVEVVAASEALPLSAFRTIHRGDVCFDQPDGDGDVNKGDDGDGVRATVDAWPLWRRPPDGAVAALDTAAEAYRARPSAVPPAVAPGPRRRHTVETSCTWLRGGVCTGFCELVVPPPCQPQDQQKQVSAVSAAGAEAASALRAVCRAVRALLDGAGMAPTDLRTLRIYHTVNNTDEAEEGDRLRAAAADAVAWGLGVRADFPVLFVPTSPPGGQDQPHRAGGTLFTVHFMAVDTLKLNSVTWIHGL